MILSVAASLRERYRPVDMPRCGSLEEGLLEAATTLQTRHYQKYVETFVMLPL